MGADGKSSPYPHHHCSAPREAPSRRNFLLVTSYRRRRNNEFFAAGLHQTLQLYPAWNVFAGAYISSKIRPKKNPETE